MTWLVLIGGIQFLGFGFTLMRLALDEWQQWHAPAKLSMAASEDRPQDKEFEQWNAAATT